MVTKNGHTHTYIQTNTQNHKMYNISKTVGDINLKCDNIGSVRGSFFIPNPNSYTFSGLYRLVYG